MFESDRAFCLHLMWDISCECSRNLIFERGSMSRNANLTNISEVTRY